MMMGCVCYFVIWSKIVSFFSFFWVGIEVPDHEVERFAEVCLLLVAAAIPSERLPENVNKY